jgi:glycosidase
MPTMAAGLDAFRVRANPHLYEINTWPWLEKMSQQQKRQIQLGDVPDAVWDGIAERGFNIVWLMGIWRRSAESRRQNIEDGQNFAKYNAALPGWTAADVISSPYAVTGYVPDARIGPWEAVDLVRKKLHARGMALYLDFVGNHTALDHPWTREHPEYYVLGTQDEFERDSSLFYPATSGSKTNLIALGKDPYFPPWRDVAQLNYFSPELRAAQIAELKTIASFCDGVRCDMAMLLLPEVFQRTWGVTPEPFWPRATAAVREKHPGFTFMAEVYWDLEWTLQQQGFDYCYDKRLYDRLKDGHVRSIRDHLRAGLDYQDMLARFLENHDEPRAAIEFPWPRHAAAAIITFFSPGLRFFYQGQFAGAQVRVPTHLCRGPVESISDEIASFYGKLLRVLKKTSIFRNGAWSLIEPQPAWTGNWTSDDFVAYAWAERRGGRYIVVVNYARHQGQCRLPLPFPEFRGKQVRLTDAMGTERYNRDGDDLVDNGLYIDHSPWRFNVFNLQAD